MVLRKTESDEILESMRKVVAVNDRGRLIGEHHQNAKLTNAQVDEMRDLREDQGLAYGALAKRFSVPKSTVADICKYRRRAQTPARWKTIKKGN
jgi:hypothetical protein